METLQKLKHTDSPCQPAGGNPWFPTAGIGLIPDIDWRIVRAIAVGSR
ncbi:hypothetical protein ACQ9LF_01505 [Anaerohalosphaeraceae bacterium U12dextr]|jgi:hypothetical protein